MPILFYPSFLLILPVSSSRLIFFISPYISLPGSYFFVGWFHFETMHFVGSKHTSSPRLISLFHVVLAS